MLLEQQLTALVRMTRQSADSKVAGALQNEPVVQLERSLSCAICYSLFDTPLVLKSCGHSFCSACIRQNLDFQERKGHPACPTCRKPCDARELQANVSLRDATEKYRNLQPVVLALLQKHSEWEQQTAKATSSDSLHQDKLKSAAKVSGRAAAQKCSTDSQHVGLRQPGHSAPQQPVSARTRSHHGVPHRPSTSHAARSAPAGHRGHAAGERHQKRQRRSSSCEGRKSKTGGGEVAGLSEQGSDGPSVSSGSEFEVEAEGKRGKGLEDEEHGGANQLSQEAIDLVDESQCEESGWEEPSDAESLSPPMRQKNARRRPQPRGPRAEHGQWGRGCTHPPREGSEGGQEAAESGDAAAVAALPPGTPQGFVRCPICSKTVPGFYINSHVDTCLASGGASTSHPPPPKRSQQQQQQQQQPGGGAGAVPRTATATAGAELSEPPAARPAERQQGPFEPLAVPAKLVPGLASEKSLRGFLAKYGLPPEGKKKDMLERYNALRIAVETANDRQERTTYQVLARRVLRQGRQRAAAGGQGGPTAAGMAEALLRKQQQPGGAAEAGGGVAKKAEGLSRAHASGHTFKALAAAIRARRAAKKAAAAAPQQAAAAAAVGNCRATTSGEGIAGVGAAAGTSGETAREGQEAAPTQQAQRMAVGTWPQPAALAESQRCQPSSAGCAPPSQQAQQAQQAQQPACAQGGARPQRGFSPPPALWEGQQAGGFDPAKEQLPPNSAPLHSQDPSPSAPRSLPVNPHTACRAGAPCAPGVLQQGQVPAQCWQHGQQQQQGRGGWCVVKDGGVGDFYVVGDSDSDL